MVSDTSLASVADAIREKGGTTAELEYPEGFVQAISDIETGEAGIPEAVKTALLEIFKHVAYVDDQGQAYYDALYAALYGGSGGYPRLQAVYAPGSHVVYTDDALDTLKPYLTVKRLESAGDSGTVVTDYTLSGTLVDGLNTVLVRKDALVTAVQVEAIDYYNQFDWSLALGNMTKQNGGTDTNIDGSPSRLRISAFDNKNQQRRRTILTERGKAPLYRLQNGSSSVYDVTSFYPIPVPDVSNHFKITMEPTGQDVYAHFIIYDESTGKYGDSILDNRITWTTLADGIIEKDLIRPNGGKMFMVANFRYNSSASDYPVEPTAITVEFSEVQNG